MSDDVFLSICIPAYNHPDFLEKCLKSITKQSFSNFEVIVTDDSLHDDLKFVVNKICDTRIKYFKNSIPLGSPSNWNYCISLAKGNLIKIMHHDDWFYSNECLQKFVDVFLNYPNIDFAFAQCYNVASEKTTLHAPSSKIVSKIIKQPHLLLFGNVIGAPSTTIFTKKVAAQINFNQFTSWYVDIIFYIDVFNTFREIKYINQPLVNITTESQLQVTNSISGLKKIKEVLLTFELYNSVYEDFKILVYLQLIDIFRRYRAKGSDLVEALSNRPIIFKLLYFSKFPINYRVYALLRRLYLKFFI